MKRIAFTLSVTLVFLLLSAMENRFLFGLSSVHAGMTQEEVFQVLGQPEFYETEIDNWYFLRFYPLIFGAINVKIDMRDSMAVDQYGRSGDRVTSIGWKRTFCLDTKDNIHRLSH